MPEKDYSTGWTEGKCRAIEISMAVFVVALFLAGVIVGC